jgi:hypothetical protein
MNLRNGPPTGRGEAMMGRLGPSFSQLSDGPPVQPNGRRGQDRAARKLFARAAKKTARRCANHSADRHDNSRKAAGMRTGLTVKLRFVKLAAAMLLLSGFTQAELEKAKNTKEFFKDSYWKCLATEILRVVPTNMTTQEFFVFTKRACPKERNDFFNTLSSYIEMLHPDADKSTVISAANVAILEAQKDAVKALDDLRSGKRQK